MVTKTKAAQKEKEKEEAPEKEGAEAPDTPLPLLDLSDAAVKKLIRTAKKRGYVTHDQINSVLPSEEVNSEQIEDILAMFSEMGVNVVETEEATEEGEESREEADEEPESEGGDLVEVQQKVPAKSEAKEPTERTDDPVRMYLREMGSVELLSREGEIAIAKRIEAGREAMIAGLCESPLTFQAIIIWRDELNEGKVFLRDIIDLDDDSEEEEKQDEEDETDNELVEVTSKAVTEVKKSEPGERTDDPVRMYLREMGTVELLSREGEIAIAKRIEAGREAMIAGLCESPLTFQAIIIWRDELNEGKIFLRDIIDLEATYAGPDAKANPGIIGAPVGPDGQPIVNPEAAAQAGADVAVAPAPAHVAPPAAPPSPTPFRPQDDQGREMRLLFRDRDFTSATTMSFSSICFWFWAGVFCSPAALRSVPSIWNLRSLR